MAPHGRLGAFPISTGWQIAGGPAARQSNDDDTLKFAFDGDAVLFSDEAEKVYQAEGLEAFSRNEQQAADEPLIGGPFKPFLAALHSLQSEFSSKQSPIRTALVTARAAPAHERVIKTLRDWNIRLDESLFLGGMKKSDFLLAYGADIFFDDQAEHCRLASEVVATGHVVHGVSQRLQLKCGDCRTGHYVDHCCLALSERVHQSAIRP